MSPQDAPPKAPTATPGGAKRRGGAVAGREGASAGEEGEGKATVTQGPGEGADFFWADIIDLDAGARGDA